MTLVPWRAELVGLIDKAQLVVEALIEDPARPEPNMAMLARTKAVLAATRDKVLACHVPPPDGQMTLGLARGVLDWVDDPKSPLFEAIGAVEQSYSAIPPPDVRFRTLPDFTPVFLTHDASPTPPIADGQALVTLQNGEVAHVGIWRDDGRMETPINDFGIMKDVGARLAVEAAHLRDTSGSITLICPPDLTHLMVWPEDCVGFEPNDGDSDVIDSKRRFLTNWAMLYPETPPISHFFKHRLTKRWARVYSLPDTQRYAKTGADWAELLHRQNSVIDSLIPHGTVIRIVINFIEIDSYLFKAFDLENIGVFVDTEGETVFQSFQFETSWERHTLNPLLTMIAYFEMRAFIIAPDSLIAPYDGGMDIIFKDPHTCWEFKRRFKAWVSDGADNG